jgi:hypothetical protein
VIKGSKRVSRMERYIHKKLLLPPKAADLILVYAGIKTSNLQGFSMGDIVVKPALREARSSSTGA